MPKHKVSCSCYSWLHTLYHYLHMHTLPYRVIRISYAKLTPKCLWRFRVRVCGVLKNTVR